MEARLIPYGTIDYTLPKGAEAAITGLSYQDTIKDTGVLEFVPAGHYQVRVSSEEHRTHSETLDLQQNQIVYLKPDLQPIEDHTAETLRFFSDRLDRLTESLSSRERIQEEDIQASEGLLEEIDDSISDLSERKDTLKEELSSEHDRQRVFKIASWVSLGIGVGSFGGMGYSLYMGNETYNSYLDAQTSDEAVSLREETLTYQTEMEKPYSYRSLFRRHRELDYLN